MMDKFRKKPTVLAVVDSAAISCFPSRPRLVVHGDGVTDDADAFQAYLDGLADLVHADGTPFEWPGAPGRRYHIGRALYLDRSTEPRIMLPLGKDAWFGVA